MKTTLRHLILIIIVHFTVTISYAQIENVIVETYYVSDSLDATNTTGGYLEEGSITYRVYIDLKPDSKIRKIYGNSSHPLKFSSTAIFYNNTEDGETFAKDFSKNRYADNTVALDSWLTLGQTTRFSASTNFGILKNLDRNGSFIGGVNNDGGSSGIAAGLLTNSDLMAGIPLITSDGMDTMTTVPTSWVDYGFTDSGIDTTVFGSTYPSNSFISYNAGLQNSGVGGVLSDSNQILVAQLTTKGTLSFEINVEIEELIDGVTKIVKYVANDSLLEHDEIFNPHLKYPAICGCIDPDYLEAQTKYACEAKDSCKTLIVFGCTDTLACNYNPLANFNIQTLCCYIGYCNDLDVSIVCPDLVVRSNNAFNAISIYPNPTNGFLNVEFNTTLFGEISYELFDSFGRLVLLENLSKGKPTQVDVSTLQNGIYIIHVLTNNLSVKKFVIKI